MFNFFKKSDSKIQKDVISELKWDPRVSETNVEVSVREGIVTLNGTVPHYFDKSTAENAAQRVGGVRAVADEIEVDILGSYVRGDSDIAKAAVQAIDSSYTAPEGVKVTVAKGWITLTGEVDWDFERIGAKNAVSHLMGVRGVTNDISIKSRAESADIKTLIEDALQRSAESEGRNIRVSVKKGVVTLSGDVHSYSEIQDAKLTAWNTPGVMSVENHIMLAS